MTTGGDRRAFFKQLLREAAGVAEEVSSFLRTIDEPDPVELETWPPRPVPAKPARGTVDDASLDTLCSEVGLEQRAADVRRLARASVRLTPGTPPR